MLGVIVGLIVSVQSVFQGLILRHQWARDTDHDALEKNRETIANTGAKAVADVLSVVKDTMDTRLIQEKEAKQEADAAKQEVEKIRGGLTRVVGHFERLARSAYARLESIAFQLAKTRRHDFKEMPSRLADFAGQFDDYESNLEPLAPKDLIFSPRVLYVRGIAAHYASQPELVKRLLSDVAKREQPESGETELEHRRRLANAYYYLGVNESNFANYSDAIRLFEKANDLDLDNRDLLSRIVTVECYVFSDQLDRASEYIESQIDARIEEMKKRGDFRSYHVPLEGRVELIKANVVVIRGAEDWPTRVQSILEPACANDPDSYYALSTLAQSYQATGDKRSQEQFDRAYECIVRRRHLETTHEVRSRILLLMVAGICSKMGSNAIKKRMPEDFLDEAKLLLDRLPRRDTEECTVFSPVTKRNENRTTLAAHIGQIESGSVLPLKKKSQAAT